jgi:hypothetical protein
MPASSRSRKASSRGVGKAGRSAPDTSTDAPARKLIAFDPEILQGLTLLARDRMQSFQELADEAFADLLKKHGRPVSLKQALRESVTEDAPSERTTRKRS